VYKLCTDNRGTFVYTTRAGQGLVVECRTGTGSGVQDRDW